MTKDSALNRRRGGRKQQRFFWGRRNDKISAVVGGRLLLTFGITFGILFGLLALMSPMGQSATSIIDESFDLINEFTVAPAVKRDPLRFSNARMASPPIVSWFKK